MLVGTLGAQVPGPQSSHSKNKSWFTNKAIGIISSEITERTGLHTKIEHGSMNINDRTITLQQVELGEGLIVIPKAYIKLNILKFLQGRVGIESILIDSPVLNMSKQKRSEIKWNNQVSPARSRVIPKIIVKKGILNALDESLILGKGIYRFEALLFSSDNGYINFTCDSKFMVKNHNQSTESVIGLIGELSPVNNLTTRIKFSTPIGNGNGDGQINLNTGETKYSLYSNNDLFSKLESLIFSSIPLYQFSTSKTSIKVNRKSKDSDWIFYLNSQISASSLKSNIDVRIFTHIPNNSKKKVLKLDYADASVDSGFLKLTKMNGNEFIAQVDRFPIHIFDRIPLLSVLSDTQINGKGRIKLNPLSIFKRLEYYDLKGDFSDKTKNLGAFGFDSLNGRFRLKYLSFNKQGFAFETTKDMSSSGLNTPFVLTSDLEYLLRSPYRLDKVSPIIKGKVRVVGSVSLQNGVTTIDGNVLGENLYINTFHLSTLSGKIFLSPEYLIVKDLQSQGLNIISGAFMYPIKNPKNKITGHLDFSQSDFRQLMTLWDFDTILDSNLTGRVNFEGKSNQIIIKSSLIMDNPRLLNIDFPTISFALQYDQISERLNISDLKSIYLNERALPSSMPDSVGLRGQATFDFKKDTLLIKIYGDFRPTLSNREDVLSGLIDVDIQGLLRTPFGYINPPMGRVRISPYPNSEKKISFTYDFNGTSLLVDLEDGSKSNFLRITANGDKSYSNGLFKFKLINDDYLKYLIGNDNVHSILGSSLIQVEGKFTSTTSNIDYSVEKMDIKGVFDDFGIDRSRYFYLTGTKDSIKLNLTLTDLLKPLNIRPTSINLQGLLPLNINDQLDIKISGQSSIDKLSSVLNRLLFKKYDASTKRLELYGYSNYELKASGRITAPQLNGSINLQDGSIIYEKVRLLDRLNGRFNLYDQNIGINPNEPIVGIFYGAPIKIQGDAKWSPSRIEQISIISEAQDIKFQNFPGWEGLRLRANTLLKFDLSESIKQLSGKLDIKELSYLSDQKLFEILSLGPGNEGSILRNNNRILDDIRLDIDISSNSIWQYNSDFIKAEFKPRGMIKASGILMRPNFEGQLLLIPGGRFTNTFPAGDLILEKGSIQMMEDVGDPFLDLNGSLLIPGYKLNIGLIGKLSNLEILVNSTPSLKRNEIFTLLLDPEYATNLYSSNISYATNSGYQTISDNAYRNSGSALFTSFILSNLQTRLRKSLGLDRVFINIRTGASGRLESSYQVGINLGDTAFPLVLSQNQIGDLRINAMKLQWTFPFGLANLGISQTAGYSIYPSGEIRFNWSSRK